MKSDEIPVISLEDVTANSWERVAPFETVVVPAGVPHAIVRDSNCSDVGIAYFKSGKNRPVRARAFPKGISYLFWNQAGTVRIAPSISNY